MKLPNSLIFFIFLIILSPSIFAQDFRRVGDTIYEADRNGVFEKIEGTVDSIHNGLVFVNVPKTAYNGFANEYIDGTFAKRIAITNLPSWDKETTDQKLGMLAMRVGIYDDGSGHPIQLYDYGISCDPPKPKQLTLEQIADAKAKADEVKKTASDKALKYNQDQAAKGDAYGLLRMGERYRDGDGVEKNLAKAKEFFNKAVAAGSPSAAEELGKLTQSDVK
jgi:TPR repeat protein